MQILLDNLPIVRDAMTAAQSLLALGYPVPSDFASANTFTSTLGPEPGRGRVLLVRGDYDALDAEALHSLTFLDDAGRRQTLAGLVIVAPAVCLTPGTDDDPAALYLVELADARFRLKNRLYQKTVNRQYNCRSAAYAAAADDTKYYAATTNGGGAWTWSGMVASLWALAAAQLGPFPGLPISPDGVPEDFVFCGAPLWDALCAVLERLGCAVAPKADGTFTVVQIGAADTATSNTLASAESPGNMRLILTREPQENQRGKIPATVRVHFRRRHLHAGSEETTPNTVNQWQTLTPYTVDVAHGSGEAVVHKIWDDLPALYDATGALTNAGACATRAAARAADYYRMLGPAGAGWLLKTYTGVVPVMPGSQLRAVRFGQAHGWAPPAAGGLVTEVYRYPGCFLSVDGRGGTRDLPERVPSNPLETPDLSPTWPNYPVWGQTIRLVDCGTSGNAAANSSGLYDAYVQRYDPDANAYADRERVWAREMNLVGATAAGNYPARLSGYKAVGGDGRPVYQFKTFAPVSNPQCTTTGTTCAGTCLWAWSQGLNEWVAAGNSCTPGCSCSYPSYCGGGCSANPDVTNTYCVKGTPPPPPYCGSTAPCGGNTCTWYCFNGELIIKDPCGVNCGCNTPVPAGPFECFALASAPPDCELQTATCNLPTTTTIGHGQCACSGSCNWQWDPNVDVAGTSGQNIYNCWPGQGCWVGGDGQCNSNGWCQSCECAAPSEPGTYCHEPTTTGCVCLSADGTPCIAQNSTTTPEDCPGTCKWQWSNLQSWQLLCATCVGPCTCPQPSPGTIVGQTAEVSCQPTTTTTSSTTTSTTTTGTTTTSGCEHPCQWLCSEGFWNLIEACPPGCVCAPPTILCNHGGVQDGTAYFSNCGVSTTTTTTTSTTTTPCTTSTTTTGSCGNCTWGATAGGPGGTPSWFLQLSSCTGSCGCVQPPCPPTLAQEELFATMQTPCASGGTTTSSTTTTTGPCLGDSADCAFYVCVWTWNGSAWTSPVNGCTVCCGCGTGPTFTGAAAGDTAPAPCVSTTTTAGAPCGACTWHCSGGMWTVTVPDSHCTGGCSCQEPVTPCTDGNAGAAETTNCA